MLPLKYNLQTVMQTLAHLQHSGGANKECIVLWLGRRKDSYIEIVEAIRPAQIAKADMFHIPPESMKQIMVYLRTNRLMIAAQVHSHPAEAFHSSADDTWAIIRHIGAISIVLPNFAFKTSPASFIVDAAIFSLDAENRWVTAPKNVMEQI